MTKPLSPTQTRILTAAAEQPLRLAKPPVGLPAAARNSVFQSMLRAGLLKEVLDAGSASPVLRITAMGLEAVKLEPGLPEKFGEATTSPQEGRAGQRSTTAPVDALDAPATSAVSRSIRTTLRGAAADLLVAWDAGDGRPSLAGAVEALRAALSRVGATRSARNPSAPRRPREGTKQAAVLALLRRPEGATVAQIMEATGWAQHTVRGFLAGLKTKGHTVEVLERVRQVGPGAQGAKESYSVYRTAAGSRVDARAVSPLDPAPLSDHSAQRKKSTCLKG